MKKFVLLIIASVAIGAFSDNTWTDSAGKNWSYTVSSGKATITGVSPASGGIAIPSSVSGYQVTSIGSFAFERCKGLTSVTIPNSVTSIESYAFLGCSGLTSVTIGNGVTSIGDEAFGYCSRLTSFAVSEGNSKFKSFSGLLLTKDGHTIIAGVNGVVTIPNSVTRIGERAFEGCSGLTSVTIPDSVTSIGAWAFYVCSGLTSVTIGNGVTSIGKWAFSGCSGLTSVAIPDTVTSIGEDAFFGCSGLTSVTIGNSVTSIGSYAFYNCSGLTSVTIPDSVTRIGERAFEGCSRLTSVTIGNSVTSIGSYAFEGCSRLMSVTIGNSVTSIGSYAFSGCSGLASVTIPDSVTSIGSYAFEGCSRLTSVTIGNSVTSIGSFAFSGCSGLADDDGFVIVKGVLYSYHGDGGNVRIPDSVTSIGNSAFSGCSGLTSVTIGNGVMSIGQDAFYNCSGLRNVTVPQCVCSSKMSSIFPAAYQSITHVVILDSVTSIGSYAFSDCSGLTSVTIPDSVTSIGNYAFSGCSGLTSVTIPDSVTSIGNYAFFGCNNLNETIINVSDIAAWCTNAMNSSLLGQRRLFVGGVEVLDLQIPDGVACIGDNAFNGCSSITSVTIPDSVTSIGNSAFSGCNNLNETIINVSDIAVWCTNAMNSSLLGQRRLFVGGVEVLDLQIPDGVACIGDNAFNGCSSIASVTIPDSVTSIGRWAFSGCSGLTSVTIGNGVTSIGGYAFRDCSGLTSVTIPQYVLDCQIKQVFSSVDSSLTNVSYSSVITNVGNNAFRDCSGLTSVTIPDSVTSIGQSAFSGCSGLTSVTIPDSVTSIERYAFSGCSGLTSVTIPDSVTSIGDQAFWNCSELESITIPDSVTSIGDYAFARCSGLRNVTVPQCVCSSKMSSIFPAAYQSIANVVILDSVTSIGSSAFSGCSGLASVTIPDSVTSIANNAFSGCSGLRHITIPQCVCSMRMSSIFAASYSSIAHVVLLDSVTSIGNSAFSGCRGLKSISIPSSVTSIGSSAFSGCTGLESIAIPATVTSIGSSAFSGCTGLKSVEMPNSVTAIEDGAFQGCTGLESIAIPASVTSIGSSAFSGCTGLKSVEIPNSVTAIGFSAFSGCNGLKIVTIPDGTTSIGASAFAGCTGLTSVIIPQGVSNIGREAFKNCTGLRYVEVARGQKEMLESVNAFAGCSQELEIAYVSAEIQDVTATQRYPWDTKIDVSYTIRGDIAALARERGYSVNSLTVMAIDMETHTTNAVATLSGSMWLAEGPHTFVWDMGAQGVSLASGNVVFTIECNKTPIPISYCVIDLSAGANATSYPVTYLDEPPTGGFNTDEYKTTKLVLRRIDNGSFVMGGGCNVTLTRPFYCSIFEVTQKQYALVMGDNPSHYKGDTRPVDNVSWNMIRGDSSTYDWPSSSSVDPSTFIGRIQARTGLSFDLPTEAQWEYACRAGTTSQYNNGSNQAEDMNLLGRYSGNTSDGNGGYAQYTVVGSYAPNAWGLYDMHGNVWEWCLDWYYGELPTRATDPVGSSTGSYRVMRGGNYLGSADDCTSSYRQGYNPSYEGSSRVIGIRLAKTMSSVHDTGVRYEKESEGEEVAVYERHDGGSAQWQLDEHISHGNDSWSLRSGAIGNNQESWFEVTVPRAGRLSFWWKASSEWDGDCVFDYAFLSIDGVPHGSLITDNDAYQLEGVSIGGDADWRQVVVDMPGNGEHVVRWTYKKDEIDEGETGEDCAWVDDIDFAPFVSAGFALGGGMGSLPVPIEDIYGAVVTLPSQSGFAREDYVFDGWSDGNGTYSGGAGFTMPYNDVALTAQWTRKTFLSFDLGGGVGTVPPVVKELEGTNVTLPTQSSFEWQDHVFDGWSDGTTTYAGGSQYCMPSNDVTLTAQWITKRFLTFKLDGGAGNVPGALKDIPGAIVTLPSAEGFVKAKHTFVGWSDGSEVYDAEAEYCVTEDDREFKAVWRRHELAVSIASADVANGGVISTQGATITISAQADPSGGQPTVYYTLDGSTPTKGSIKYVSPLVANDMSVTVKAIAVMDNYFDSNVAEFSFSRLPYSPAECIGVSGVDVTTGGDAPWNRVTGGEALSGIAALRSGSIGDGGSSWVEMIVDGPGEVSFWGKISSQNKVRTNKHDYLALVVDGVETLTLGGGTIDWTNLVYAVVGIGSHSLKWVYIKDSDGITGGDDCAWLDMVAWMSDSSTPQWSITYENLKGAANPNPSKYYEGYGATFQPLSDINGYTFAGWTPNSIPANATGDKVVTANWNWIPEDATVEASITGGKALNVDAEWVKTELVQRFGAGKQQSFIAKFGDNFAAALTKKTGKIDGAGNELSVWHDYVAGTDPTDANSTFKAKVGFKDGMPVVKWEPNLNSNGEVRIYTLYGKAALTDAWHSPTNALDHFFKVDVSMPTDGTVSFNVGGGSSVDPIVVRVGQPIGDLPTPTRQGYDFLGWFTAAEGGTEITPETVVADDMTIFAHWEKRLAADLVHRWSFNGDLTDSVGGQTATKVGNVTAGANQYTLAGGSQGTSYINLGANVLPNDGSAVTLEMWVTQLSAQYYARIWDFGNTSDDDMYMGLFNTSFDRDAIVFRNSGVVVESNLLSPYTAGTEFHIAVVMTPQNNGRWKLDFYKKDSSGTTLRSYSATTTAASWTLLGRTQSKCYLGHAIGSANDANASYNELRIWKKAMTEAELTASAIAGPDANL